MTLSELLNWMIILLPLSGAIICGMMAILKINRGAHWPAIFSVAGSAIISVIDLIPIIKTPDLVIRHQGGVWMILNTVPISFTLQIDSLTEIMLCTVTFVSLLVIIYSREYMKGDPGYSRFFAAISLFVCSMCVLVLAGNFLMLYLGWEGVGLCSFLLIGFWYKKPSASDAAVKAFLVTRIGDTGFAVGILLIFLLFGSLDYNSVFVSVQNLNPTVAVIISLLLFSGAVGKSAQLPLYVWLPDAMEGPTPVSALIHAATMVTAGVYMVARCGPIFSASPIAMDVVAVVGALTAIYAATIALAQYDVKRILAYSTISQLGYMFLAMGVMAPSAGMFHLVTHAFFKALLFLSAGSLMHAMNGVVDIRELGGLKQKLPFTRFSFLIGCLALSSIFPFSGFWSKDQIIYCAFHHWPFLGVLAWLTAILTAFYSFRLYFRVFYGPEKIPSEVPSHIHDAGSWMRWPMIVLMIGSIGIGLLIGWPPENGFIDNFGKFPLRWSGVEPRDVPLIHHLLFWFITLSAEASAIFIAWKIYGKGRFLVDHLKETSLLRGFHELLNRKYYIDEVYDEIVVKPVQGLAQSCDDIDSSFIDPAASGIAAVPSGLGYIARFIQNGTIQTYALTVTVLLAVFLMIFLWIG
jgi:NADH-quinone oxidoreductase subunit L